MHIDISERDAQAILLWAGWEAGILNAGPEDPYKPVWFYRDDPGTFFTIEEAMEVELHAQATRVPSAFQPENQPWETPDR